MKNSAIFFVGIIMKEILKDLFVHYGSYSDVANALQYSDRQYRNIRRKVERGETLQPRIEQWIINHAEMLKRR